jgi:Ser/Thr protein kinase RdoA (MazF antagonist)
MNFLPSPNDKLLDELPDIAIQGDYHPGNLLFQDESVSGVLDFD